MTRGARVISGVKALTSLGFRMSRLAGPPLGPSPHSGNERPLHLDHPLLEQQDPKPDELPAARSSPRGRDVRAEKPLGADALPQPLDEQVEPRRLSPLAMPARVLEQVASPATPPAIDQVQAIAASGALRANEAPDRHRMRPQRNDLAADLELPAVLSQGKVGSGLEGYFGIGEPEFALSAVAEEAGAFEGVDVECGASFDELGVWEGARRHGVIPRMKRVIMGGVGEISGIKGFRWRQVEAFS
jgi:hypothetical protein